MKYFKRLVFAALLAVGAIFLVACGSTTSDHGKYVDWQKLNLKEYDFKNRQSFNPQKFLIPILCLIVSFG